VAAAILAMASCALSHSEIVSADESSTSNLYAM
jgi:hypothetical protein